MTTAAARSAGAWARISAAGEAANARSALDQRCVDLAATAARRDDLSREVYCILGLPIDAIEMPAALRTVEAAAAGSAPFVLSTPNLNFLVATQTDSEFRESVLLSDLCPADGMPIVWIARLIGVPIRHRVAGSDIFDALSAKQPSADRLKVCLFGGADGAAAAASRAINARPGVLSCVGAIYPGYGSVDQLSRDDIIDQVNASRADFLMVSLGAQKGQIWLQRNHDRLRIPIRAHLGAVINFQAGKVKRAPALLKRFGLEWLWRIKEEPYLWKRYWHDGVALLRLLVTQIVPLAVASRWLRWTCKRGEQGLAIRQVQSAEAVTLRLCGAAIARYVDEAISRFRDAVKAQRPIIIDCTETRAIDARFLGLLLMLRKRLAAQRASLTFIGVSPRLARMIRLNGAGFLLTCNRGV